MAPQHEPNPRLDQELEEEACDRVMCELLSRVWRAKAPPGDWEGGPCWPYFFRLWKRLPS